MTTSGHWLSRWPAVVLTLALAAAGCSSSEKQAKDKEGTSSTSTSASAAATTVPPAATTAPSPSTTRADTSRKAAAAVVEPDSIAGVRLGANKSEAIAVLGSPTTDGQEIDLGGAKYDYLRWSLDGNRGLTLNFRTDSVTSPLLTDWMVNAPGPRTAKGIQVGDASSKVTAAYGALSAFCCEAQVASVEHGGGRMVVVVDTADGKVVQIIGGDESFWSRSIAD